MNIDRIVSVLNERYFFEKISNLELLKGGVSNSNYIFSDGDQRYVKIERENIVNAMEFIAFRQCVYAKSMMSKGSKQTVKDFSSYWTLLHLYENGLTLGG